MSDRFAAAMAAIDAANAGDPNTLVIDGVRRPKEQAHAELMTAWLERLDPQATEAQRLAARAHHLRRWTSPRSSYPDGRAGYLRWRAALKQQHADEVGAILTEVGYDEATIATVQRIILKDGVGRPGRTPDRIVQVHEDALCLVFLQTQLADTVDRLGDDHMIDVIRKTVAKMSSEGIAQVGGIAMRDHDRELIGRALA